MAPVRVSVPVPALEIPNPPEIWPDAVSAAVPRVPHEDTVQIWFAPRVMLEDIVWVVADVFAVLVTVMLGVVPPKVMLPPESVMFEEEPAKVSEFALTAPETVIVPVASWFALVPKIKGFEVVVVVVPERAVTPVEEVVQP